MRLLNLPAILRGAGLTVHEYGGWRTRGSSDWGPVRGITCHHTAGARNSTDAGELRVLVNGSSSAPPPIAQLYLSRSGAWWVVASGRCNHNLVGWGGPNKGLGNRNLLGIEAQHSGGSEPWTDVQYNSYARGVAALCRSLGVPVSRVAGHKEHQPGAKSDPTFNMDTFRSRVAAVKLEEDEVELNSGPITLRQDDIVKWSSDSTTLRGALESLLYYQQSERYKTARIQAVLAEQNVAIVGLTDMVRELTAKLVEADGSPETANLLAALDTRLGELQQRIEDDTRDALADMAEGGVPAVRADAD